MPLGRSNSGQTPPEAELESGQGAISDPPVPFLPLGFTVFSLQRGKGPWSWSPVCHLGGVLSFPRCGEFFWVYVNSEQMNYTAFKTFGAG